jgi:hypothetical protein
MLKTITINTATHKEPEVQASDAMTDQMILDKASQHLGFDFDGRETFLYNDDVIAFVRDCLSAQSSVGHSEQAEDKKDAETNQRKSCGGCKHNYAEDFPNGACVTCFSDPHSMTKNVLRNFEPIDAAIAMQGDKQS